MKKIIHISDLHFGTEDPDVVEALRQDVDEFGADLLVVSGDLTQRAKRAEFQAAKQFVDSLGLPSVIIPGNHDIPLYNLPLRVMNPFKKFNACCGNRPAYFQDGEVEIIGLNSVRNLRWKSGRISSEQLNSEEGRIGEDKSSAFVRLLAAHHNLFQAPVRKESSKLFETQLMHDWLIKLGFDLVLFGHDHRGLVKPVARGKEGGYAFILVQAGTAVSCRVRGVPNSYNRIEVSPGHCAIQVRELEDGAFCRAQDFRFTQREGGWYAV